MIRRRKAWLAAAAVFTLVNVAGAVMAGVMLEGMHALTHVALVVVGVFAFQYVRRESEGAEPTPELAGPAELDGRLMHLEMTVEDVATQVERLGEGQRFLNRLFAEKGNDIKQRLADVPQGSGERPVRRDSGV